MSIVQIIIWFFVFFMTNFSVEATFYFKCGKNACFICDEKIENKNKYFVNKRRLEGDYEFFLKFIENNRDHFYFDEEFITSLGKALTEYDKQYDKISDGIMKKCAEMRKLATTGQFYNLFQQGVMPFYNPAIGNDLPIIVFIVDSLSRPFYINSTIFIGISTIPRTLFFGRIVRYACEVLYEYRNDKNEIQSWFLNGGRVHARPAFVIFKEVLAHSVSRWILFNMGEQNYLSSKNGVIDEISSQMCKLISEYLSSGRTIDRDFVDQYIDICSAVFEDSNKMQSITFSTTVVIKAESDDIAEETLNSLKKVYGTKSYTTEFEEEDKFVPVFTVEEGNDKIRVTINEEGRVFVRLGSIKPNKIQRAIQILNKKKDLYDGFESKL